MSTKGAQRIFDQLDKIESGVSDAARRLTSIEVRFESHAKTQEHATSELGERLGKEERRREDLEVRIRTLEISRGQVVAIAAAVPIVIAVIWQLVMQLLRGA
jgi:ribosomal protein S17